ncbi:MAG: IS3 family transposase [Candidatus Omnitrophota bacterium]
MLLNRIQNIYKDNKGRYGSPRIKEQLEEILSNVVGWDFKSIQSARYF